jgi:hypothetical protein
VAFVPSPILQLAEQLHRSLAMSFDIAVSMP